jgi:Sugar efflux transporter for intercellular exchange
MSSSTSSSSSSSTYYYVLVNHVCPSIMVVISACMYGASVRDLLQCVRTARLRGVLNPLPWAIQAGNCLGWVAYAYYTADPYMLAANLPGLLFGIVLNVGAIKVQYQEQSLLVQQQQQVQQYAMTATATARNGNNSSNKPVPQLLPMFVEQEQRFLGVLVFWTIVLIGVGWVYTDAAVPTIGLLVNANLVLYYGAPLQAMSHVIQAKDSSTIHLPTLLLGYVNTSLWILFGAAARNMDWYILLPNLIGLSLGLAQGALCVLYPRRRRQQHHKQDDDDDSHNGYAEDAFRNSNNGSDDDDDDDEEGLEVEPTEATHLKMAGYGGMTSK